MRGYQKPASGMTLTRGVDSNKNKLIYYRVGRLRREFRRVMTETEERPGLRVDYLQGWVNSLNCLRNDLTPIR